METINKLVRDRIPEIIAGQGKSVTCHTIKGEKPIIDALFLKLSEEVHEFEDAYTDYTSVDVSKRRYEKEEALIEELADVYEVLHAICHHSKYIRDMEGRVQTKIQNKRRDRGSFDKMWYLESTNEC